MHNGNAVYGNDLAPNANRLLWGGFMAILAAGIGFAIRGGFLDNWRVEFNFTDTEIGNITGAGFTGFCFGIIIGGIICDKIGYGKLVIAAFALHVLSAVVTFAAHPAMDKQLAASLLTWGSFIFAFANGTLEAVANPLVATLFFHNRTHYLNILHASWPAGLVLGSASGWVLDDIFNVHWKLQFSLFLVPTVLYGLMFFAQRFPKSEASQKGLRLSEMFKDVGFFGALVVCCLLWLFLSSDFIGVDLRTSATVAIVLLVAVGFLTKQRDTVPLDSIAVLGVCVLIAMYATQSLQLPRYSVYVVGAALLLGLGLVMRWALGSIVLFALFIAHGLVGAVELGTDNWIQNITGNILTSEQGKWLFVFTSMLMFTLRFCADFIEKKIGLSPVGILLTCAILACVGLLMSSSINTFAFALLALAVYGIGKTFFWPTMLAVASDRFPRTGAIAISIMGGIGMMSAGLIGAPGLGYSKDRFAGEALADRNPAAFEQYKAQQPSKFLPGVFAPASGLDGKKLGTVQYKLEPEGAAIERLRQMAQSGDEEAQAIVKTLDKAAASIVGDVAPKTLLKKLRELAKDGDEEAQAAADGIKRLAEEFDENPEAAREQLTAAERDVIAASIAGDRKTLIADAVIPAIMAVIYLILLLYFKAIGGYKPVHIEGQVEGDLTEKSAPPDLK